MSDLNVKPTPIQRNKFDVAMELTQLYIDRIAVEGIEDIEKAFARFYALAVFCERSSPTELQKLLSEELINQVGKLNRY